MKLFLLSVIILIGCSAPEPKEAIFDYFDEKDYEMVEIKKDSSGVIYYEKLVNKKDTSRKLVRGYWENGEIQSSIFLKSKIKDGPARRYDTTGALEVEFLFIGDKKSGVSTYYDKGKIVYYTIHYQGKEFPISEEMKKEMLQ